MIKGIVAAGAALCLLANTAAAQAEPCRAEDGANLLATTIEGNGRPIVMLGGGLMGPRHWQPHAERLSSERRVVRPQALNVAYGLADRPLPRDYSVRMESCAVAATLQHHGVTAPVDLVGISFGALVALDYALNYPERIRTLTLVEPPAVWLLTDAERLAPEIVEWTKVTTSFTGVVSEADLLSFTCAVQGCPSGATLAWARQQPNWSERVRHRNSLRLGPAVARHRDDQRRLRTFHRPIMYVAGIGGTAAHERFNAAAIRALPQARVIRLPGGHAAPTVSLDAFMHHLRRFQD